MPNAGDYTVTATDTSGCQSTASMEVIVNNCGIIISEAMTPNGDGENDVFFIENLGAYPKTSVTIFNRWGSTVYESDDYMNDWDGRSTNSLNIGGDQLPEGTYFYVIKLGGDPFEGTYGTIFKGYVYLKR